MSASAYAEKVRELEARVATLTEERDEALAWARSSENPLWDEGWKMGHRRGIGEQKAKVDAAEREVATLRSRLAEVYSALSGVQRRASDAIEMYQRLTGTDYPGTLAAYIGCGRIVIHETCQHEQRPDLIPKWYREWQAEVLARPTEDSAGGEL
jgi:hypothetical protein